MEQQKVQFLGLDTDSELRFMEPGSYRYALNVHIGTSESGNRGAVENIKGNTLVSIALPAGVNKVIGAHEDLLNNATYYFLYNINEASLAVSAATFATPIEITTPGSHHLLSNDVVTIAGVNDAANGTWEITKVSGTKFTLNGSIGTASIATGTITTYKHGLYKYNVLTNTVTLVFEWSGFRFDPNYLITGTAMEANLLYWTDNNQRPRNINVQRAINGEYGSAFVKELFNDAKQPPALPPMLTYVRATSDEDYIKNLKSYQVRYRYVYIDSEKSAWSPVSKAVATGFDDYRVKLIRIEIGNCEIFTIIPLGRIIAYVEFAIRDFYTFSFYQIKRVGAGIIYSSNGVVDFYDTDSRTAVPTDETDLGYSRVPQKAGALAIIKNRKSKSQQ